MQKISRFFIFSVVSFFVHADGYRTINGTNNNLLNPLWGSKGVNLIRYGGINSFSDGISAPTGGLPSARYISNILFGDSSYQPDSALGLSDFATYWGQFLAHDIDLTSSAGIEPEFIQVPSGDTYFDPLSYGNQSIPMSRSKYDASTGTSINNPRQHINEVTSFLDASTVYGSDDERAAALRTFTGGLLKTSQSGTLPPLNTLGLENQNAGPFAANQLYAVGDVRGNENPGLLALHVLFLREHNRLATNFATLNPGWSDEQLYQEARKWVIAEIQHITYREYIPSIFGESLSDYTGYNDSVDPNIFTEFSTGAFRYGHTEVNSYFWRLGQDGNPTAGGHLRLLQNYFNPNAMSEGIEPILRGMARQPQKDVDVHFVDDIRNYLFGNPGQGGLDLAAINTERGRDHGLPFFNQIRQMFALEPYTSFENVTANVTIQNWLKTAYNNDISKCEIYTCGLAEDHAIRANVGPTIKAVALEQYRRLRDGDRFWYEEPNMFTAAELSSIKAVSLSDIILRNTNIPSVQCAMMALPDSCTNPTSVTTGFSQALTTGVSNYDFIVFIALKTPAHPNYGRGDVTGYTVDGVEGKELFLERGKSYRFYTPVPCTHRWFITYSSRGRNLQVYDGVIGANGGCNNDMVIFTPDSSHPDLLYYQCENHDYMGWKINIMNPSTTGEITTSPLTTSDLTTSFLTTSPLTTSPLTTGNLCFGVTCPSPNTCQHDGTCNPANGLCTPNPKVNGTGCYVEDIPNNNCFVGLCAGGYCSPQEIRNCPGSTTGSDAISGASIITFASEMIFILVMILLN